MRGLSCDGTISIDHTFHVAANIGYFRSDRKWISQYEAVFIVMNEKGEVITWQFTKTKGYDEIALLLKKLKQRVASQGSKITYIDLDDCCHLRDKLCQTFGAITVRLDLFHAVQRLTRCIVKKHKQAYTCLQQLKMVFREDGDIQTDRAKPTPSPEIMLQKLNGFCEYWSNNGDNVLRPSFYQEVRKLKSHIIQGCLSGIPVGRGTNRNEALHRHINPFFDCSRMSVQLALAMLTFLFFCHNQKNEPSKSVVHNAYATALEAAKNKYYGKNTALQNLQHDHTFNTIETFGIVPDVHGKKDFWGSACLSNDEVAFECLGACDVDAHLS